MSKSIFVQISRVDPESSSDVPLPKFMSQGAAGMDIHAANEKEIVLEPGTTQAIPTGFSIAVPIGYEAQVRPRSGLALKHSIGILNSPGTIDSDYRGEIKIILTNFSKVPFTINRNDRIAQLVISPVQRIQWIEVEALPESTRGEGGFGHTGI